LHNSKKHKTKTAQEAVNPPFAIELGVYGETDFSNILLQAIDEAFLSLGESVKTSIYFHLEHSMGIEKQSIPSRIDDFQNALEKLFGIGTRHLEILLIKSLYEKIKTTCEWNIPCQVNSELTFKECVRLANMTFENSNAGANE